MTLDLAHITPVLSIIVAIVIAVLTPILTARFVAGRVTAQIENLVKEQDRARALADSLSSRVERLETLRDVAALGLIPDRLSRLESSLSHLKDGQAGIGATMELLRGQMVDFTTRDEVTEIRHAMEQRWAAADRHSSETSERVALIAKTLADMVKLTEDSRQ